MTTIEWTDQTWNPTTGCKKVSEGCANCYAEGIAKRFWGERKFTEVQFHPERLEQPLKWRKPRMVFVNSMSDLFHEAVTDEQLDQIFAVMALTPQHTYQCLTKRPQRMLEYFRGFSMRAADCGGDRWLLHEVAAGLVGEEELHDGKYQHQKMLDMPLPNCWLGVSVENQKAGDDRVSILRQTPAAVRFLSCEPLLENIFLANLKDIDWVIVGGESGPGARTCDIDWIESIIEQCKEADVACFVKQLGSNAIARSDMGILDFSNTRGNASNPDEWPEDLRVRQFPKQFIGV